MKQLKSIVGVDHIGYAVRDIKAAKILFISLGYEFGDEKKDEMRKVNVVVGQMGGVNVELLAPLVGEKSPIDGYLNKIGCTPYHICYEVHSMEESISELQEAGFIILGEPAISVPLEGTVCFFYSSELGLIETIEYFK